MKRRILLALTVVMLLAPLPSHAVGSKQAQYDGGTVTQISKSQTGSLIAGDSGLQFDYHKDEFAIPYASITDMEYGDKPSTRIGTSVGVALSACHVASRGSSLRLSTIF